MDNFRFDMTCEGTDVLTKAVQLVFAGCKLEGQSFHGKTLGVTHYVVRGAGTEAEPFRLVFFNHYSLDAKPDKTAFPFVMDATGAAEFAARWLAQVEYQPELDHDGDNHKGWRLYNENWGHIDGDHYGVIAVSPEWAMYGK